MREPALKSNEVPALGKKLRKVLMWNWKSLLHSLQMGTTYSHYSFVLNSINILLKASFVLKWPESRLASAMWVEKSGHATVVFGRNCCCCCRRHLRVEMLVPAQGWNWSLYLGQGHEVAKKRLFRFSFWGYWIRLCSVVIYRWWFP